MAVSTPTEHANPGTVGDAGIEGLIPREELLRRIDALGATHKLVGPVMRSEPPCDPPRRYFYEPVRRAAELALEFDYCVYGPKSFLLPAHETLMRFNARNRRFEAVAIMEAVNTALVGVHPCDIHAIGTLDRVFSQDRVDRHYLARRERLFIVGLDCARPCTAGAFCADLQTNSASTGFDVMLYPLGGPAKIQFYGVVFGTSAGRDWLAGAVRPASTTDRERFQAYLRDKVSAFPRRLTATHERLPAILQASYDSPVWEANALRCYSCGSCNLVCPTCYCFDIQDENGMPPEDGCRSRVWDGCMLRDFALVAGGHNFRLKQAARLRHRIMRKGAWIEQRSGHHGCVGCARCERACTAHIGISDIFNQLSEEHPEALATPASGSAASTNPGTNHAGR